jgi:hypothetical protein
MHFCTGCGRECAALECLPLILPAAPLPADCVYAVFGRWGFHTIGAIQHGNLVLTALAYTSECCAAWQQASAMLLLQLLPLPLPQLHCHSPCPCPCRRRDNSLGTTPVPCCAALLAQLLGRSRCRRWHGRCALSTVWRRAALTGGALLVSVPTCLPEVPALRNTPGCSAAPLLSCMPSD